MSAYKNIINKFKNKNILVVGDLILDQHIRGHVSRISPEAPVPIVLQEGAPSYAPGGAANVANNLRTLGAQVALVGRIGDDREGEVFLNELRRRKISTRAVILDQKMPTILKTRVVAQHQQVLRVDREKVDQCSSGLITKILSFIHNNINVFDAIIISDYGKGMITAPLLQDVCDLAKRKKKIIAVDPKDDHFGYYREVTVITPNKKETENAIRNLLITQPDWRELSLNMDRLLTQEDVIKAGEQLLKFLRLESLVITLGEHGMCLFEDGKKPVHIHTRAKEVFDVTGAGDTVISVFTLSLATGASKLQSADLANYAASVVVGKMGTATVTRDELLEAIREEKTEHT